MFGIRPRRLGGTTVIAASLLFLAVATIGFGVSSSAGAQDATPPSRTSTAATITVNGHGSVYVQPDTASVTLGVDVIRPTLNEAQSEATTQMTAVIDAVKAAGIADEDIQTAYYSVNIIRDYDESGNPAEVRGYQVSNQVNVTIREIDRVGEILDAVVAVGANSIYGISFSVDDPSAAASQARTLAVEDARAKAEELAAAAGLTIVRIVSISETGSPSAPPIPYGRGMAEAADMATVPVQTGTSEVTVDVQMTFEVA